MKCDNCNAPKKIKESLGCNADRLHNQGEILRREILKIFKVPYEPKFNCRFADLIESDGKYDEK